MSNDDFSRSHLTERAYGKMCHLNEIECFVKAVELKMRIPAKPNAVSEGKPTGIPG